MLFDEGAVSVRIHRSRYSDLFITPSVKRSCEILGEIAWQREARNPEIYEGIQFLGVLVCSRKT